MDHYFLLNRIIEKGLACGCSPLVFVSQSQLLERDYKTEKCKPQEFYDTPCFLLDFLKRKFYARDNNKEYSFSRRASETKGGQKLLLKALLFPIH